MDRHHISGHAANHNDTKQLLDYGMDRDRLHHMQRCAYAQSSHKGQLYWCLIAHWQLCQNCWCKRLTSSVNAADARSISAACWLACSVIVTSNSSGASLNAAFHIQWRRNDMKKCQAIMLPRYLCHAYWLMLLCMKCSVAVQRQQGGIHEHLRHSTA